MADNKFGRQQRDRGFRDRNRRDNNRYNKDYYDRRSPYSSDDEERDQRDNYQHDNYQQKDNYNNNNNNNYRNHRRHSNDSWNRRSSSNRNERYRSRSRERSQSDRYDYDNNSNNERDYDRKKEEIQPNNTIMMRNLGLQINENEIMNKLAEIGLRPKEIRLMRKKDTGESRGFAFVEFNDVSEATYWKEQTQGHIIFSDGQQASLHYSIPKDSFNSDRNNQQKTDWTCYKCGVVNFKRRDVCFKCSTTREESEANETSNEIDSIVPTNCLLFRNLNPYTTEERILTILGTLTTLPIKSIKIPKENLVSTCVCFVELYTTHEASQIYALLSTMTSGFIIDDFPINICYAKRNVPNSNGMNTSGLKNAASTALAAAQWTNQSENSSSNYQQSAIIEQSFKPATTEQSNLPATLNPTINIQIVIPLNAPVLTNGIDYGHVTINNQTYRKYPVPDAKNYRLEETSGFYYDSLTCLYYDPNSHYYYNGTTQKYMYWSNDYQTYIPVETASQQTDAKNEKTTETASKTDKKNKANGSVKDDSKVDKVKMAKKIAKDMEKWAKMLNQKSKESSSKQTANTTNQEEDHLISSTSTSSYNSLSLGNTGISLNINSVKEIAKPKLIDKNPLFETYNDNDNDNLNNEIKKFAVKEISTDEEKQSIQKLNLTDWNKLICLLCKRQFNSKEQLNKHQQASELHKTNLFKLTGFNFTQEQIAELSKNDGEFNFNYRDRAKERRLKYGQSDQPEVPSSRYKEKYTRGIKNILQSQDDYSSKYETDQGSSLSNSIGAKLLKNMGWSDGKGLGKTNQGRSSLIEVERRQAGVGLGIKTSHPSGESYKDAVKRTMIERYKELHEKEINSK